MCRGFGILANFDEILYKEGNSSHSGIIDKNIDNYIKLEILMNTTKKRGYDIEIDSHVDIDTILTWTTKQFLIKGKLNQKLKKIVEKWCKENELIIFKSFCFGCQSYSTIKGNNDQSWSTIEGNNRQFVSTIKGDNCQSHSTIEGDNDQSGSTIKGDNDQSSSTIEGEFYIGNIQLNTMPRLNKLLRTISTVAKINDTDLTLPEVVKWIIKNPKKAKKILGL